MRICMYFRWQAATVVCVVIIAIQQQSVAVCLAWSRWRRAQLRHFRALAIPLNTAAPE